MTTMKRPVHGQHAGHRFLAPEGHFTVIRLRRPRTWWQRLLRRPSRYDPPVVVWTPPGHETGYAYRAHTSRRDTD